MMPRLLDLYSCAGGAARGYANAGFEVVGVDINPQPNYPYEHHVGDALEYLDKHWREFDAIHASPPCQAFSRTKSLHTNTHPELVEPTREALSETGKPWVIENVVGAPLINPLQLCGTEFDMRADDVDGVPLKLVRHRLFESNIPLVGNGGCRHDRRIATATVYGAGGGWTPKHRDSPARRGGYIPDTGVIQKLLGIDWMTKREMSQVVPPIMAEFIGRQLLERIG